MKDKSYADNKASETGNINDIIVAVDLGSSHLTMMAGRVLPDKTIVILDVERELCRGLAVKGLIENPTEVATCLVRMSKLLKNRLNLTQPINRIFVSLGGKNLRITEAEAERSLEPTNHVSEKCLREMEKECRDKFEQQYPNLSVAEVIWGTFILDNKLETTEPLDEKAKYIKGIYEVYYGPEKMRKQWEKAIGQQDQLQVACYFVNTEALRTLLLNNSEEQEGCAIINFGSDTTTYSAYHHGKLLDLLVVPYGSHNITKAIAYKATSMDDAEKLKKKCTSLITPQEVKSIRVNYVMNPGEDIFYSTDKLSNIAKAESDFIFEPVIERINENIDILEDKTLYVTGGGALQKGLIQYLQEKIPMNVQMSTFIDRLSENTDEKYASPEYAQIVGTLLLGADFIDSFPQASPTQQTPKGKKKSKDKSILDHIANLFKDTNDL